MTGYPTRSVVLETAPSVLRIGGDLAISGDGWNQALVTNQDSHLVAGGTTTPTSTALDNVSTPGTYRVDYSGTWEYSTVESCGTFGSSHCREWHGQQPHNPAPSITSIPLPTVTTLPTSSGGSTPVRSGDVPAVFGNALFRVAPDRNYLIETDPAFARYRNWLSSDYQLQALQRDPNLAQKRLGDGYYEQKLVREQVAQLTGRRYLEGFADDETQYLALMQAGATFAQAQQLIPGVSLSAEQVAKLTSDIVWLEEQEVILTGSDGKPETRKVLVPRLYVRVQPGDLDGSGGLLSSDSIHAELSGPLANYGTIAGRKLVDLKANDIGNAGTIRGADVVLQTTQDIRIEGGRVQAESSLQARAGRDLQVSTTTVESQTPLSQAEQVGGSQYSRTGIDRVASLYVSGKGDIAEKNDGTLVLSAGRDVLLSGAQIGNDGRGTALVDAGRDLKLGTATALEENRSFSGQDNYSQSLRQHETGTTLSSQGAVSLNAGRDLELRAAGAWSDADLQLNAGRDLTISSGQDRQLKDDARRYNSSGTFSSSTTTLRDRFDSSTFIASNVSGKSVTAQAERTLAVQGSTVTADDELRLKASGDIQLQAATESSSESHYKNEKKSGLLGSGGLGVTVGSRRQASDIQSDSTTAAPTIVGSIKGSVSIQAGQTYQQTGSDVLAPAGDTTIEARKVEITEARETSRSSVDTRFEQSGITVAVSNPVITAVQTADQMQQAASNSSDRRVQALAAASMALAANKALGAVKAGQGDAHGKLPTGKIGSNGHAETRDATAADKVGGINVAISLGGASSHSSSSTSSDSSRSSSITAGNDVQVTARGAGGDSSVLLRGSQVTAGQSASVHAEGDLSLQASRNDATETSNNASSSGSLGISFSTQGTTAFVSASRAGGNSDRSDSTWTHSRIDAGQQVALQSGQDTGLHGAVVTAPRVTAQIGGELQMESVQDSSQYRSEQKSAGGSLALGSTGIAGGNLALGQSKSDSHYQAVQEQTAIRAGDGGFDIEVKGNASLVGSAITSTERPVKDGKNRFESQALSLADVANGASYEGSSASLNVGSAVDPAGQFKPQDTSLGVGSDSGRVNRVTRAGISGIAGDKAVRTDDEQLALARIFDADKVQREIEAQALVTQTFGSLAPKAAADFAQDQARSARQRGDAAEAAKWEEGGAYRVAMQTAIGGLAGGAAGAIGAGAASAGAQLLTRLEGVIADKLKEAGASEALATGASKLFAGATVGGLGTAVTGGQLAGAASGLNVDVNNRQLHPDEYKLARTHAKLAAGKLGISEEEAEGRIVRQLLRNVDGATAQQDAGRRDEEIISLLGCQLLKCDADATDPHYWDSTHGSQYIKANQESYGRGQAQANTGLTPQQIVDRNNAAGASLARAGAIVLGGYALAPAAAAVATELAAFIRNPIGYCLASPASCTAAAETAAYTAAGAPQPYSESALSFSGAKTAGTTRLSTGIDTANLRSKLEGYLLNESHPQNQSKAVWFEQALGINQSNWELLASQIFFDPAKAVATKASQYGQTFEQILPIKGANGKTIEVTFVFLKDNKGTVRLVTGLPTKK